MRESETREVRLGKGLQIQMAARKLIVHTWFYTHLSRSPFFTLEILFCHTKYPSVCARVGIGISWNLIHIAFVVHRVVRRDFFFAMVTYTADSDFDEITDRDPTVELIGYVDQVFAPAKVGTKGKQYDLFKFILSNGSHRKVLCLIWSMDLISKYTSDITIHRILHIDGAYSKLAIMNNEKSTLNVLPIEIIIQRNTVVEYLGVHITQPTSPPQNPVDVNFSTILTANGLIRIGGYIKTQFTRSDSRFQTMSYGCGSITDGEYKLTVQIANYEYIDFNKGVYVTVIGNIINNDGVLRINCKDSSCIVPDLKHDKMNAEQLIKGAKTPKRKHSDDL